MTIRRADIEIPEDAAFWALVDLARADWAQFERRLRELSTPAVAGFAHMFFGLEAEIAARSREIVMSEDGADDFCGWVVACGRDFFVRALADPRSLDEATVLAFEDEDRPRVGIGIRYEAETVYHERTGEELCPFDQPLYDPEDSDIYGPLIRARR